MENQRLVNLDLGEGLVIKAVALDDGASALVGEESQIIGKMAALVDPIQRISAATLGAVKKAAPTKATIELSFSLAVESGKVLAVFGKGSGEAGITVTLEWDSAQEG